MPPLTAKNLPKIGKNQEKSGKNQEKSGKKRKNREETAKNREISFALPLLTDRAGYATVLRGSESPLTLGIIEGKVEVKRKHSRQKKKIYHFYFCLPFESKQVTTTAKPKTA